MLNQKTMLDTQSEQAYYNTSVKDQGSMLLGPPPSWDTTKLQTFQDFHQKRHLRFDKSHKRHVRFNKSDIQDFKLSFFIFRPANQLTRPLDSLIDAQGPLSFFFSFSSFFPFASFFFSVSFLSRLFFFCVFFSFASFILYLTKPNVWLSSCRPVIIRLSSGYLPVIIRLSSGYHLVIIQLSCSSCPVIIQLSFGYISVIVQLCASPSDSLISLSYSKPAFSANSFGLFEK